MPNPRPIAERFWKKVAKSDGCWLWTGAIKETGYGVMQRGGRGEGLVRVHRLSWEIANGRSAPEGVDVCHVCDVRHCVRPDHLFLGSRLVNMQDAASKGRVGRGETHCHAILTEQDVRAIREARTRGVLAQDLAERYGVSQNWIYALGKGRGWKHLLPEAS